MNDEDHLEGEERTIPIGRAFEKFPCSFSSGFSKLIPRFSVRIVESLGHSCRGAAAAVIFRDRSAPARGLEGSSGMRDIFLSFVAAAAGFAKLADAPYVSGVGDFWGETGWSRSRNFGALVFGWAGVYTLRSFKSTSFGMSRCVWRSWLSALFSWLSLTVLKRYFGKQVRTIFSFVTNISKI